MDAEQLIRLERKYSPTVEKGRGVFSPLDKNSHAPWNIGGDKMAADRNGYAEVYARLLDGLNPWTVVELGVFRGESMALWCDVFTEARVVGLDVDLSRFEEHKHVLLERGAFRRNVPDLHTFDAYSPELGDMEFLYPIDLFVDDGPHTPDAVENVLRLFGPQMNARGVYVIEDFLGGGDLLAKAFPKAQIIYAGRLNAARL